MITALFVGGSLDHVIRDLVRPYSVYSVPVLDPASTPAIYPLVSEDSLYNSVYYIERYTLRRFNVSIQIYALTSLTDSEVFAKVLEYYIQKEK